MVEGAGDRGRTVENIIRLGTEVISVLRADPAGAGSAGSAAVCLDE